MTAPVYWSSAKVCDFCGDVGGSTSAPPELYDAATKQGPWALMCQQHFDDYGRGMLGTGFGQKYVRQDDGRYLKVGG